MVGPPCPKTIAMDTNGLCKVRMSVRFPLHYIVRRVSCESVRVFFTAGSLQLRRRLTWLCAMAHWAGARLLWETSCALLLHVLHPSLCSRGYQGCSLPFFPWQHGGCWAQVCMRAASWGWGWCCWVSE
jgi:hypothetical protein